MVNILFFLLPRKSFGYKKINREKAFCWLCTLFNAVPPYHCLVIFRSSRSLFSGCVICLPTKKSSTFDSIPHVFANRDKFIGAVTSEKSSIGAEICFVPHTLHQKGEGSGDRRRVGEEHAFQMFHPDRRDDVRLMRSQHREEPKKRAWWEVVVQNDVKSYLWVGERCHE